MEDLGVASKLFAARLPDSDVWQMNVRLPDYSRVVKMFPDLENHFTKVVSKFEGRQLSRLKLIYPGQEELLNKWPDSEFLLDIDSSSVSESIKEYLHSGNTFPIGPYQLFKISNSEKFLLEKKLKVKNNYNNISDKLQLKKYDTSQMY